MKITGARSVSTINRPRKKRPQEWNVEKDTVSSCYGRKTGIQNFFVEEDRHFLLRHQSLL
jgi:hypothetical protein